MSLDNACSEFEPEDCRSISELELDRPVTVPADVVQHNLIIESRTRLGCLCTRCISGQHVKPKLMMLS